MLSHNFLHQQISFKLLTASFFCYLYPLLLPSWSFLLLYPPPVATLEAGTRPSCVGLGAAAWVEMAAGNAYTFPLYSHSLKSVLGFNQQQLTMLSHGLGHLRHLSNTLMQMFSMYTWLSNPGVISHMFHVERSATMHVYLSITWWISRCVEPHSLSNQCIVVTASI